MPTRTVNLTETQDAFVERLVRSGKYQNASEAVRDAIRGLEQRLKEDALRLRVLRREIRIGIDELDRGDYVEVADADLEATLDGLAASRRG